MRRFGGNCCHESGERYLGAPPTLRRDGPRPAQVFFFFLFFWLVIKTNHIEIYFEIKTSNRFYFSLSFGDFNASRPPECGQTFLHASCLARSSRTWPRCEREVAPAEFRINPPQIFFCKNCWFPNNVHLSSEYIANI